MLLPLPVSVANILEGENIQSSKTIIINSQMLSPLFGEGTQSGLHCAFVFAGMEMSCKSNIRQRHVLFSPNVCTDADLICFLQIGTNLSLELNHHFV